MRSQIPLLWVLAAALLLAGCKADKSSEQADQPSRPKRYDDAKRGFSIRSVTGWAIREDAAPAAVSIQCESCPGPIPATVTVSVEDVKEGTSASDYATSAAAATRKMLPAAKAAEGREVGHAARRAYEVELQLTIAGQEVKAVQTYIVSAQKAFTLTQTDLADDFAKRKGEMRQIVDSFRILQATPKVEPPAP